MDKMADPTVPGVGGGGPLGRLLIPPPDVAAGLLLDKLVAEPWAFLSWGSSPLGNTNFAPAISKMNEV